VLQPGIGLLSTGMLQGSGGSPAADAAGAATAKMVSARPSLALTLLSDFLAAQRRRGVSTAVALRPSRSALIVTT
jgi:hypothetical protein